VFVSVNVSARQLQQPVFAEAVDDELNTTGFDPARLVLEVTETMPVGDDRSWTYLNRLRDRGVRVAIDDYGTGHASLTYLRQPIVDLVKIDQSFVDDLSTTRDRRLLQAITELCRDLGLETIAEGVADADRRDALIEVGCRYGQGFYFSPALTVDQAAQWVAEHPLTSGGRTLRQSLLFLGDDSPRELDL
jgi:EAL domain-containing protein (putative c-di-GMP-specific phosphodiesterase class I)